MKKIYNNAYRLTREARVSTNPLLAHTEEFSYDAMGNRTQRRKSVQGNAFVDTDYAYNTANQLTSEYTGGTQTDYSYDDNGNMIQKQANADVTNYGFDDYSYRGQTIDIHHYEGTEITEELPWTLHRGKINYRLRHAWVTENPGVPQAQKPKLEQ